MSNWKLHTPNGVNDILPDECAVKKEIESTIWSVFSSIGYKEVETPTFEYYDCYLGLSGQISQEHMFKFFDEQGRILALRPDFTTSIARMAATKVANSDKPQRYLYTGNVYRVEQTQGARQREFTQSGIELIGSYSPAADAEVISAAMEAVLAVGIEEFSMEIGQIAFFNGLVKQAGLDEQSIEKLRERIDSKDSVGIKTITDKLDIDDNIKNLMIDLPYLFGGEEVFKKAYVDGLNEESKNALDNLKRIYELLCLYGFEKYVSIDLGMLESIDYYTGSIFKCYTHGVGFPICAGGRYDNLMEIYGDKLTLYINGYIKNLHDSEDLLIEVFAYLISKRPNIKSSFESYIYKAARNHALMFLRKAKRHIILTEEEMNFCIENTFEDEVCVAERNKRIYDCMEYLPSAQKEALYLVYIEGMSYKEAAAVLRKSAKQIDKLLQLGKKKLRPLLETEGIKSAFND